MAPAPAPPKNRRTPYRDDVATQRILGVADWTAGLKARKEAIEKARKALRELPRPESLSSKKLMTWEEFDLDSSRRLSRAASRKWSSSRNERRASVHAMAGHGGEVRGPAGSSADLTCSGRLGDALASLSPFVEIATRSLPHM